MDKVKEAFKAMPHINKLWVTEDGHFHLHEANGGDLVTREEALDETKAEKTTPSKPENKKK